jgi:thiamine biosynthesis protein ThiS
LIGCLPVKPIDQPKILGKRVPALPEEFPLPREFLFQGSSYSHGSKEIPVVTAQGKQIQWHEGMTIKDVLTIINFDFPYIYVTLDGKIVQSRNWDTTRISDGSKIDVHAIVAGG